MYNPYKVVLPLVNYIGVVKGENKAPEYPDISQYKDLWNEVTPQPVIVQEVPAQETKPVSNSDVKIDTKAYVLEESEKQEGPKENTPAVAVLTSQQYTPLKTAENKTYYNPVTSSTFSMKPKMTVAKNVKLYSELENEILPYLQNLGVSGIISSAIREGAIAPNGNPSYHASGRAFDLIAHDGNFKRLYEELEKSGALKYLNDKGYFVLYEDKKINPKSTGVHLHIGKDIATNHPVKGEEGLKFPTTGVVNTKPYLRSTIYPTDGPVDLDELKKRQAWAESNNNPKAVSKAGAIGLYQVMPSTLEEYIKETGDRGDLTDPKYNTKVRDWYFNVRLPRSKFISKGNPTDSVRIAKLLATYNSGATATVNALNKAKADGINIYHTFDWLPYLNSESRNYVNFILRNQDTGGNRTNEKYNKYMK